jgi:hypothetical protein
MQRLLSGSRLLLGLAVPALVAYGAVRLLASYWAWLALFVAAAYLIMLVVTLAALVLYFWFGLPADLDVRAPLCDEKDESSPHPDRERGTTGSSPASSEVMPASWQSTSGTKEKPKRRS